MKDPEIPFPFLEQRKFRQKAIVRKDNDYLFICLFYFIYLLFKNVNKQKTKALRFREVAEKVASSSVKKEIV